MIDINPKILYTAAELTERLGIYRLRCLRKLGLRAAFDLYPGKIVLEYFERTCRDKNDQRVLRGKEEKSAKDTKITVAKSAVKEGRIQPVSGKKRSDDLGSQLQDYKRKTTQKAV